MPWMRPTGQRLPKDVVFDFFRGSVYIGFYLYRLYMGCIYSIVIG